MESSSTLLHREMLLRRAAVADSMVEYLIWRGDLPFTLLNPGSVDALIFSTLAYVGYDGVVPEDMARAISLRDVVCRLLEMPEMDRRLRVEKDRELLMTAAETERFARVRLCRFRNVFIPEEETQFAAVTFLLEDGTAFLAFRGTDRTMVGWKEDFNMMFQDSIPAQRLAQTYVQQFAEGFPGRFSLCGHSKGGNLAVYAAARCDQAIQNRIDAVYNHDGPGFTETMLNDPGYLRIVPKILSYVPQSSVIGMLLERREPCMIVKSRKISVMQHDPYSWVVAGGDFIPVEERTADSRFLDKTVTAWLSGMSREDRNELVDAVFDGIVPEDGTTVRDMMKPKNIKTYLSNLRLDEDRRRTILHKVQQLAFAAAKTGMDKP